MQATAAPDRHQIRDLDDDHYPVRRAETVWHTSQP
jgi:hypothetical protein